LPEADYATAAGTIRCDCGCHPQSVADCACGRAAEMRDEIRALAAEGQDAEAIIAHYVAAQGEQILLAPPAHGFNLVAWLGPLVGLVLATAGVMLVLRRWLRARDSVPVPEAAPPAPLSAEDTALHDRLRRAIEGTE
jgi:cytochrome c-type biogenesis protein CcmH